MHRADTHTRAEAIDAYDYSVGKVAFEKVRAEAEVIPTGQLRPLTLDLGRLADVLEENQSAVEHDRKHYRPTDVVEAR